MAPVGDAKHFINMDKIELIGTQVNYFNRFKEVQYHQLQPHAELRERLMSLPEAPAQRRGMCASCDHLYSRQNQSCSQAIALTPRTKSSSNRCLHCACKNRCPSVIK